MAKTSSAVRQASSRAAAAARREEHRRRVALAELAALREQLERLDLERLAALRRRDAAVAGLRAAGVPWADLAAIAGTTRQALMKRLA